VRIVCSCITPGTAYTTTCIGWEAMDRENTYYYVYILLHYSH